MFRGFGVDRIRIIPVEGEWYLWVDYCDPIVFEDGTEIRLKETGVEVKGPEGKSIASVDFRKEEVKDKGRMVLPV